MPKKGHTRQLSEFIFRLSYSALPPEVVVRAKHCLLDYLACSILGQTYEHAPKLMKAIRSLSNKGACTVIGFGDKTTVSYAALVNGALGSTQLDDTCLASLGHPAVGVMPVVLAMGEWLKSDGKSVITAIAAGYELAVRVGTAAGEAGFKRGWHARGGVNVFGAAAAASVLLGPKNVDEVCHSLGLAGTQASGLNEASFFHDGWHLLSGSAAQDGVLAAILAHQGYTAGCTILEGPMGYLQAVSPEAKVGFLTWKLGEKFGILDTATKRYPASHLTHSAIETAENIVAEERIESDNIDRVTVGVINIDYLLNQVFPRNFFEASMNTPFLVSYVFRYGLGPRHIKKDELADPVLRKIYEKIRMCVDDEMEGLRPKYTGAVIRLMTKDGRMIEKRCLTPKGDPENPLTEDDLRKKFDALTKELITPEKRAELWRRVIDLQNEENTGVLLPLTC